MGADTMTSREHVCVQHGGRAGGCVEGAPVTERARGVGLQERQAATARSRRLRHDFMLSGAIDGMACYERCLQHACS